MLGGWRWVRKLAEGGQAEIFETHHLQREVTSVYEFSPDYFWKVFKEPYSLRNLQRQWPLGMLQNMIDSKWCAYNVPDSSPIFGGLVLANGKFAFLMWRYWSDLRKLIDIKMQDNHNHRPFFDDYVAVWCMLEIAIGMRNLHKDNILHSDLKASNVLRYPPVVDEWRPNKPTDFDAKYDGFGCHVADFETSIGVAGTGFWRAPEILLAVKNRKITPNLFTHELDVYSFAITCYEILTGRIPFEDLHKTDYDFVLRGEDLNYQNTSTVQSKSC